MKYIIQSPLVIVDSFVCRDLSTIKNNPLLQVLCVKLKLKNADILIRIKHTLWQFGYVYSKKLSNWLFKDIIFEMKHIYDSFFGLNDFLFAHFSDLYSPKNLNLWPKFYQMLLKIFIHVELEKLYLWIFTVL